MKTHSDDPDGGHPPDSQLERYRLRSASPAELLAIDAHLATCDRCFARVSVEARAVTLASPGEEEHLAHLEHLEYEELERFVDGRAGEVERELVTGHVEGCTLCRDELRDLEAVRDSLRPAVTPRRPRRTWAIAAMLILALATAWLLLRERTDPPPVAPPVAIIPPAATTAEPPQAAEAPVVLERPAILNTLVRGDGVLRSGGERPAFRLETPVGTVVREARPRFRWTAAPDARSYDVAVVDAERGSLAARGSTSDTSWTASTSLPRGRTYSWQVTAHAGELDIVAPGPSAGEALFHVEAADEALPEGWLERGLALARRGVLDEAERELQRAASEGEPRAQALLDEVRSWRQRALPTTTNGAQ